MGSRKVTLDNGGIGYADDAAIIVGREAIAGLSAVHPEGWRLDGLFRVHQLQMVSGGAGGSFSVKVWGPAGAFTAYAKGAKSSWAEGELLVIDDVVTEFLELTPTLTGDAAVFALESFEGRR